jgi:GNAT superfamily N-acetyltransferase
MDACRALTLDDIPRMVEINEQGLPGTGKVSEEEMADLLQLSELALGLEDERGLVGFVLCLLPGTRYGGIGSLLYQNVVAYAHRLGCPVTAEVSLRPPNPGSVRFHARHGFDEIGVFETDDKAVTMYIRTSN